MIVRIPLDNQPSWKIESVKSDELKGVAISTLGNARHSSKNALHFHKVTGHVLIIWSNKKKPDQYGQALSKQREKIINSRWPFFLTSCTLSRGRRFFIRE